MDIRERLPADWRAALAPALDEPWAAALGAAIAAEVASAVVYPPPHLVFSAFERTPFAAVRVLLLGQDPYHGPGQAHGLCFSVPRGVPPPPSLRNVLRELAEDLGVAAPGHGELSAWAARGVLLLNAALTVRAGVPASHAALGWHALTDAAIRALDARPAPLVFMLWGAHARRKASLIDARRHALIESGHPSPLSQRQFLGSRPFSRANAAFVAWGQPPIDWSLPR